MDCVLCQIVVACPKASEDDLDIGLLDWQLGHIVTEHNIVVKSVLSMDVGPDTPEQVIGVFIHDQRVLVLVVTSVATSFVLVLLGDFLCRHLGVDIHVLKDVGTDIIELFQLDVTEDLGVVAAPIQQFCIILSQGRSLLGLHGSDNVLSDLGLLNSSLQVSVYGLFPLSDKEVEVSFTIDIRQWVTSNQFWLLK